MAVFVNITPNGCSLHICLCRLEYEKTRALVGMCLLLSWCVVVGWV